MLKLLVPLDTSTSAALVLAQAEALATNLPAAITLFHVIEPLASYVPVGAAMDVITTAPPDVDPAQLENAKFRLEQLAGPLRSKGIAVECEAVLGLAVDEILDQAKLRGSSYILLGSHGHGALYHLFSGSVVTGVLKHSTCPVIVVPIRK